MNNILSSKALPITLITVVMFALPGCDWLGQNKNAPIKMTTSESKPAEESFVNDDSGAIATIGGKPLLTEKMFEKEKESLLEKNPQLKQVAALIPDIDERLLEGCIAKRIINYHIEQKGIDQTEEYQQDLKEQMEEAKTNLNGIYFAKLYPVNVTDAEAEKYYKEKRDSIPELVISRGGVQTKGISFADEAKAKEFLEKVKGKPDQLEKIAQDAKLSDNFQDFQLLNVQSVGVDQVVRDKVLTLKKFPTVELIKGKDGKFWVVAAVSKEEPKYHPFDQVKEPLKEMIMREKQMKVLEDAIAKLKDEYNVEVDQECLKKRKERNKPAKQGQLPALLDADFEEAELENTDSPMRSA